MVLFSDSVVAGAVSGGVTRLLIAPLDVLKVRFQLQLEAIKKGNPTSKYQGVLHATKSILKEEGTRAFWKGLIPGELLFILFGATQFTTYEVCSKAAHGLSLGQNESWKFAVNTTCGSLAGFAATSVSQPFDTLRTRLIGQGEPKMYPSLYRALVMMYSENGIRTFYKGLTPALLTVVPQAGLHFGFYHSFTGIWDAIFPQKSAGGSVKSLVCGALAGILSKTIMLPPDLIKKRLQVQGFEVARLRFGRVQAYRGTIDCFISIFRQEGPLAFYKGTSIALMKSATSVALSFFVYEKAMKQLQGA